MRHDKLHEGDTISELDEKLRKFKNLMVKDINVAIEGEANYLVALALSSYTEFLGGLYRCQIKEGQAKRNYNNGLKKLGEEYIQLLDEHRNEIYARVRCGLVHEYFIKGTAKVWMNEPSPTCCGIEFKRGGSINFYVTQYFDDFQVAISEYIDKMKTNKALKDYFLSKWKFDII